MPKPRHQQINHAGLEVVADEFTGKMNSGALASVATLTDNSAGTADNTVAAMPAATAATTDTSAASLTSVNTALTAVRNNVADLTAKVNAILNALK